MTAIPADVRPYLVTDAQAPDSPTVVLARRPDNAIATVVGQRFNAIPMSGIDMLVHARRGTPVLDPLAVLDVPDAEPLRVEAPCDGLTGTQLEALQADGAPA